jgi:putative transposase
MTRLHPEDEALDRFRLIQPYLEKQASLSAISRQHVVPLRTLQRWVYQYRQRGIEGLSCKPRIKPAPATLGEGISLKEMVEGFLLSRPRPSIATVYRRVVEIMGRSGNMPPSYQTIWRIASAMDPALLTLAHDGIKAYSEQYSASNI